VKRVFTKSYDYFDKVFSHNGVQQLVRQFATTLTDRRQLSHTEVAEALAALSGL
jgi:hypothetical protein